MFRRNIHRSLLIALVSLSLQIKTAFPQDVGQPGVENKNSDYSERALNGSIKKAVKEAIKESGEEKDKKHAQLLSEFKSKLNAKAQEWIIFSKHSREAELNKLQHTDWDLAGVVNYPVPYDYYLRGFDYSTILTDVKNDSLFLPYKANINISEKLYVEGIHSSDATDISQYYYTLSRIIVLNLEYEQNNFIITNTDYGPFQVDYGWRKD